MDEVEILRAKNEELKRLKRNSESSWAHVYREQANELQKTKRLLAQAKAMAFEALQDFDGKGKSTLKKICDL